MAFLAVPSGAANEVMALGDVMRHLKSESIVGILPRASSSTAVRVGDHQTRLFEKERTWCRHLLPDFLKT
ncbi:MAG: hypothetical protein ACPGLY_23790, partial [Rubripirellula sp.]